MSRGQIVTVVLNYWQLILQALQEIWSGISQVSFMQQLAQKDDFGDVVEHLKVFKQI